VSTSSSTTVASATSGSAGTNTGGTRRRLQLALLVIATAQLMLVLDDTVANVALPSIQADLGLSASALPWVINAYVVAFGGLLLFGGRLGDLFGRRRILRVGMGLFTAASLLGGLAPSGTLLIAARALQGIGAAMAAPSALALVTTTFPAGKPRNQAMAVYGAMSALGLTGGVLLGGLLTGALSWRWVLLINLPIGLAVLAGTRILVDDERHTGRLDTLSAVTGTGGAVALAYGLTRSGEHGWTDILTLAVFAAAVALLAWFVILQARSAHPLLPLRLLTDRNRTGAYATVLFIGAGLMGTLYLATLFMQQVLDFSPLRAGAATLPFGIGIAVAVGLASKLVEKFPPRTVAAPGLLVAALGMFWLSTLEAGSGYWSDLMVPIFLASAGLGLAFVPMTLTAVHGVAHRETGVASALLNTAQQIGAALGLAVLTTVAVTAATGQESSSAEALAHGYGTAYLAGGAAVLVAAVLVALLVTAGPQQQPDEARVGDDA
jgi:EmrB/QacA subfamily drug resistance transporter